MSEIKRYTVRRDALVPTNFAGFTSDPVEVLPVSDHDAAMAAKDLLSAELRKAAKGVKKAWEHLGEGRYSPSVIENWLAKVMKPAMISLRDVLSSTPEGVVSDVVKALKAASDELHHANSNPGTRAEVSVIVDALITKLEGGGK